jgi:hypothetical protein
MSMQEHINIARRSFWRNVLQAKRDALSPQIQHQRPFIVAIAITPDQRDFGTDHSQLIENDFRADIAEMPDFIGLTRHLDDIPRQPIMRVREDKNAMRLRSHGSDISNRSASLQRPNQGRKHNNAVDDQGSGLTLAPLAAKSASKCAEVGESCGGTIAQR